MEPLLHFVIPFVALSLFRVRPKIAFFASVFALLPDIDILFWIHKWVLHSIVPLIVLGLPAIFLLKRTRLRNFAPLAFLAMLSHPIFDVFYGYVPAFWPIWGESVWIDVGIDLKIGDTLEIDGFFEVLTEPTAFEHFSFLETPLLTSTGLVISTILIFAVLLNRIRSE